jgi:hypothetical protein
MKKATLNSVFKTALLSISAMLLFSCEELIKDLTTIDIPVESLKLNFGAEIPEDVALASAWGGEFELRSSQEGETRIFSGKDTLRIDSEEFAPYAKYANLVKSLKVTKVQLEITSDKDGSVCKNLTLKSVSLNSECTINELPLNELITADKKLQDLLYNALDAVMKEQAVDFEFYGESDAPEGSKIKIDLVIDGVFTVQLLESK